IYYEVVGKGEPIVLLHAGFLDHTMWQQQVKALKNKRRVITLDLPAHGLSQRGKYTFLIADALLTVIDSLKIPKASWMGLSLGSVAVTDFLIAHPERVKKAILVSPGINGYETRYALDSFTVKYFPNLVKALEQTDTAGAAEVFTRAWGDGPYRSPETVNKAMRSYVYQTTLATMYKFKVSGWPRFQRPPAIERIHEIKAPLLIIAGDKDMPYILDASEVLHRTVPGSKKVIIKDVAHMINMAKPEAFNKTVTDFLNNK
ncbi:MAG TPA: alpha/beta hydrolase, partial [Flavisolibacter sp.]|nr:alpha/beta hydrolase [Flavisolibacter sp.]